MQLNFRKLVYDFSNRNLCFDGDAHDAFSAVLREYTEMTGEQFVWGMPISERHFDSALCWESNGIIVRRKGLTTLPTTSLRTKVPFPSWSWLGWKGKYDHLFIFAPTWGTYSHVIPFADIVLEL